MVDADSVLLSVQERDKWRNRMEILERSLAELRDRRLKAEVRLRRVRKDISRLETTAEALLDLHREQVASRRMDASQRLTLTFR